MRAPAFAPLLWYGNVPDGGAASQPARDRSGGAELSFSGVPAADRADELGRTDVEWTGAQ
jgi:hypothetical protein